MEKFTALVAGRRVATQEDEEGEGERDEVYLRILLEEIIIVKNDAYDGGARDGYGHGSGGAGCVDDRDEDRLHSPQSFSIPSQPTTVRAPPFSVSALAQWPHHLTKRGPHGDPHSHARRDPPPPVFLLSDEKTQATLLPLRLPLGIAPKAKEASPPPPHGARHRPLRCRRRRRPHPGRGGRLHHHHNTPRHPPRHGGRGCFSCRVLRRGALLRPGAGEPGAQGVERAGAAAAEQPPHRRRLAAAPPAAPPHRRRADRPAPPRPLAPRARLPPRPAPAVALLARLPAFLARRRGALSRAHPLRGAARHPRAALRAPAQGRRGRGARRVPPRPLGPAVRRRRRRPPRPHGRGLLRAPRAQAAARLRVRDGYRVGRGRPGGEGACVLPSRWQRRRWSRLRGIVNLYNSKSILCGQSYLTWT